MKSEDEDASVSKRFVRRKKYCDITELTGGDGPWQRRIFVIIFFLSVPCAYHNLSMSFLAPNLDHWCVRPPEARNMSVEEWRRVVMPPDDQHCSRYEDFNFTAQNVTNTSADSVIPCSAWEYDETFYSSTVLSQWDLVCDRQWLVSMSKSIFVIGMSVSLLIFGHLSDRFGRKPAIFATAYITASSAIFSAFSTSFAMFIVGRFFTALGTGALFSTLFVLLMEIVSPKYRSTYGITIEFGWVLGFVTLPLIAWLIRDWFWIQIAITTPCIMVLAIWWIPESPRWLMSRGKVEKAQEVVTEAAKINGVKLSEEDFTTLTEVIAKRTQAQESLGNRGNIMDLLTTPGLWQITLNVYLNWFVNSFVYYGLSYNTNELAGNPFINFFLFGIVECPAYCVALFVIRSLGRKNPIAASMVISGIACVVSFLIPQDLWWLTVTISMIGKFCITMSWGIVYIFSSELFPTVVRNVGVGSASFCARVGSMIAPFMRELGTATHPIVPQIIFGILAVLSGVLVLLLPETSNCSVPDTIEEAAYFFGRNSKKLEERSGKHFIVSQIRNETGSEQVYDEPTSETRSQVYFKK